MSEPKVDAKAIFLAALDCQDAEALKSFLDRECGADAPLRRRVDELLQANRDAGGFLGGAEQQTATIGLPTPAEVPGAVIGPYKLLQQIGEGGMGTVYMAEQTHPVQRSVALKVIKAGMDSKQVIARFEAERQALAVMDHVNIARVFDAGATEAGRPYFVMELVHGVPITKYCDDNHLTPRERLELFVPVCQAIQHAHQKGIIHRDIKPSNVMVTLYDGKPVPKVIDFGVAKATEQKLTERTLFTQYGTMVGTLEYMSPEQAEMSALGVDTRSDIYSLGVLLYELLTGNTPLSHKTMKEAAYAEILRMIKEEEPPKPSTRLSDSGEALASISAQRHMEPAKLTKLVRGELDWIVMKTLEKDRNRRYETASAFAADVQRYLSDETVQACPPSALYRFRKFARRNKAGLVTASVIGLAVLLAVGSLAGSIGWAVRDQEARLAKTTNKVHGALEEAGDLQAQSKWPDALAAARKAQALLDTGGGSADLQQRVRDLLTDLKMAVRLEEARLEGTATDKKHWFDFEATALAYADAFRRYGIDVETLEPAEAAERIRERAIREYLTVTLDHWASLSGVDLKTQKRLIAIVTEADADAWRSQVRAAAKEDGQSLKKLAASPEVLSQHPSTLILFGGYLHSRGEIDAAVNLLRKAQRQYPGDFWINQDLASYLLRAKPSRQDEAIRFLTAAVALRPRSPGAYLRLGFALRDKGLVDEACVALQEAVRLAPDYSNAHYNLGHFMLYPKKDYEGAVGEFSRAIELDPKDVRSWYCRSTAYGRLGRWDNALADSSQAIKLDSNNEVSWYYRAEAYMGLGQRDKAVADYSKAIELKQDYLAAWRRRGEVYIELGRRDQAVVDFSKVIELHPSDVHAWLSRGQTYRQMGQWEKAVVDFSKVIDLYPNDVNAWLSRGQTYRQQGQRDKAVADFTKVIESKPAAVWAWSERGQVYAELGRWKEAAADFAKVVASEPNQPAFWENHAIAHLAGGESEAYRQVCAGMLERFQKTKDPEIAGRVASTCVAAPEAVAVPAHLVALAEVACSVNREWNVGLLGAAHYRAGQPGPALECFKEKAKVHPLRAWDLLFMAMAHRDLHHAEEARNCLKRAVQWLAAVGPSGLPDDVGKPGPRWFSWQEEVVVQLLRRKAEELLKKESGVKNQKEQTDHKDR